MIIGVPKEVKDHETRVGLIPSGVVALREAGHEVLVQTQAGEGSSIRWLPHSGKRELMSGPGDRGSLKPPNAG